MKPTSWFSFPLIVTMPPACSVKPEFIRYTAEEIEEMRAAGDTEGVDLAERMNAACDLAEGKAPAKVTP